MIISEYLEEHSYTVRELRAILIAATLKRLKGNKTHAAKALGISLRTLRLHMKEVEVKQLALPLSFEFRI